MPKPKKLIFLSALLVVLALASGIFIRANYVVPILMYHSVPAQANYANRLTVSAQAFERQMRFLKERKFNVLTLEELGGLISGKKRIPPRSVVITFDDGYRDNYSNAFPILQKYALPATIFIIVNEVSRLQGDRLSWEEISQMRDSGLITFGCHSFGPQPLVDIKEEEELRRQIVRAKKILEEKIGRPVNTFSYPGGLFSPRIRQLVQEAGYQAAVATNPGKRYPNDDIFALKRLRISENAKNLFVFWAETSGFYNFIREHRHK
jgi:peptidoglycan/xylan/chitin deacetylase (PgdA/CDA1 family)